MINSPQIISIVKKRAVFLFISLFFLLPFQTVFSANQGSLGTHSNADLDITLTLGLLARVTGLNDFALGTWSGGSLSANDDLCIGLFGANQYRIRATGDGNSTDINAFALTNGTNFLPYRIFYNDQPGTAGQTELSPSSSLLNQNATNSFFNLFGCFNQNANIALLIEDSSLAAAGAGAYSGTLTLTLIPE